MTRPALPPIENLIDGARAGDGERIEIIDKYTLEVAGRVSIADPAEIERALSVAWAAYRAGPPNPAVRAEILERAMPLIPSRREEFRARMAIEAGFTKADADGEIDRCVETLRLSAIAARQLAGHMVPMSGSPHGQGRLGFTHRVPVGPVLAITPFNSPLNTVTHKVAPAFAAGNPVLLKPSLHTPATASLLVEILHEAGLPPAFMQVLNGGAETAGHILADQRVRYIAFTGSTEAGRSIQSKAGLRRTQMELGSVASTVVCADADLEAALPKIVSASFRKAGQVCSSIQLLHVHRSLFDTVLEGMAVRARDMVVGDPLEADTLIGPLISASAADRVEHWVREAEAAGARPHMPWRRERSAIGPVILTDVTPDMRVGCAEIFGPVVSLLPFEDFDEAIERVNATPYGLAAGVFTRDMGVVGRAIAGLDVGGLHINETSSSRVDLMPYGGVKDSGFGHEGPPYAVSETTEERLVTIRM